MKNLFSVYVIELDDPKVVYVGCSWHGPEVRLKRHLAKDKKVGSIHVRRAKNPKLRPDLYLELPKYPTREKAETAERIHAAKLKLLGYTVYGGH
jgi:hypothetical protein